MTDLAVRPMELTLADKARVIELLDTASLADIVDFRDQFEALRYRAGQVEAHGEMFRFFAEAKVRAERRAGQLLAGMDLRPGRSITTTLVAIGVSHNQSSRWQRIASIPDEAFEYFIATATELTSVAALKLAKRTGVTTSPADPVRPPMDNLDVVPDLFTTIVIDPPWRYDNTATRAAAEDHYGTMSQADLLALDMPAADEAHLYLWVTNSFLRDGLDLMEAWGFKQKTMLTWCKPQIGMGNYFRSSTEHVLFGIKGKLGTLRNDVPTWFVADRKAHSAKPESFYDLVESSSPGPYLEMFARRRRFGWHVWGNEA